jgi:phosphate transport system substrate-binding protein
VVCRTLLAAVSMVCAALVTSACALTPSVGSLIRIDGSSTVYPLTEAVAEEFLRVNPSVRLTVGVAGTGGGFKRLCRGDIDITNASRPVSPSEQAACAASGVRFVEVPVAYDGITIAVHPANDWVDHLTVRELGDIWRHEAEGRVLRWSQVRAGFPDRELHLFGAGVDSGTFDYFTEAVTGTPRDSRGDYTSSEDDNTIVQGVSGDRGSLGFFGYAYYAENQGRLKAVPIAVEGGPPVAPTPETIATGTYRPLSRPVFLYVDAAALARPEVRAFLEFYLDHGAQLAREVGYVPLGEEVVARVRARLDQRVTGTLFDEGRTTHMTLAERLRLE